MKSHSLLFLGIVLLAARASGQVFTNPLDGVLVDCGTEKVVIVEETESKDGHFAAAWTLHPNGKKAPVNWSAYTRKDPAAFLAKFPVGDAPGKGQLQPGQRRGEPARQDVRPPCPARTRTILARNTAACGSPGRTNRQGVRYGVVGNTVGSNHSENTVELFLVTLGGPGGPAGRPISKPTRTRPSKVTCTSATRRMRRVTSGATTSPNLPRAAARGNPRFSRATPLTAHFDAEIPLEDSDDPGPA